MAYLSTDDGNSGLAPIDFQISSSSSESECGQYEIRSMYEREKCPVCFKLKKNFICKDCVKSGDFWHSSSVHPDIRQRFEELKSKLFEKQYQRDEIIKKCITLTEPKDRMLAIAEEMEKHERTIQTQKQLKTEIQNRIANANQECEFIKKQINEKERLWPLYRSRLNNMEQQKAKRVVELKRRDKYVVERKKYLQHVSKSRILQLKEYIFPLQEVYTDPIEGRVLNEKLQASNVTLLSSNESWSDEEDDTVRSLMAATSNKAGICTPTDISNNAFGLCHSISGTRGPSLPISGDYSAYNNWTERSQANGSHIRNPAHVISAGLTFLTQFVNMISYFLDLRLPHRLSYSEFSIGCLQNGKFNRKVAKLNANVIHLCASQGIPPSYLQPRKTIANLLLLFDPSVTTCDLGRRGPFEVAAKLAKSMEESIEKDLVIYEDDDSDNDTGDWNFPNNDWETIARGVITEEMSLQDMTRQQSYMQSAIDSDSFIRSRNSASIAGNLVSSVTSFFRW